MCWIKVSAEDGELLAFEELSDEPPSEEVVVKLLDDGMIFIFSNKDSFRLLLRLRIPRARKKGRERQ